MRNRFIAVLSVALFLSSGVAFANPIYVQGVPDWNQPVVAGVGLAPNSPWSTWCVPTAAANIMGYYRDKGLLNSLGDAQAFPNTTAWNTPAPNFQDDTADPASSNPPVAGVPRNDIGWYMNTNDLGQKPGAIGAYGGTLLGDVKPGLDGVKAGFPAWRGYFPDHNVPVKVTNAAVAALNLDDTGQGPHTVASVWPLIQAELDAQRPVLISFSSWSLLGRARVNNSGFAGMGTYDHAVWNPNPAQNDPNTGESYTNPEMGHTVTLVGYWNANDPTNPFYVAGVGGPNAIVVLDNTDGNLPGGGALPLVLPFDATAPWQMNTEIQVPEPASLILVASGLAGLFGVVRRRLSSGA